jgi:hypothetical protein
MTIKYAIGDRVLLDPEKVNIPYKDKIGIVTSVIVQSDNSVLYKIYLEDDFEDGSPIVKEDSILSCFMDTKRMSWLFDTLEEMSQRRMEAETFLMELYEKSFFGNRKIYAFLKGQQEKYDKKI